MKNGIYPMEGRYNFLAGMYCEMAMEAYHTIVEQYDVILRKNSWVDTIEDQNRLEKAMVSCVVFSAMSIEAYLNDYAASCMGDSEFYNNFDKLSIIAKLELITKFILQVPIEKSRETYRNVKALVKDRNAFVHSKSSRCTYQGSSKEDIQIQNEYWEENALEEEEPPIDLATINDSVKKAENALKAIHGIAVHFNGNDPNAHAEVFLFSPTQVYFVPPGQINKRVYSYTYIISQKVDLVKRLYFHKHTLEYLCSAVYPMWVSLYESLNFFQRVLIKNGVIDKLREAGVEEGDTVSIGDMEFDFVE